jgi:hypothetical protein
MPVIDLPLQRLADGQQAGVLRRQFGEQFGHVLPEGGGCDAQGRQNFCAHQVCQHARDLQTTDPNPLSHVVLLVAQEARCTGSSWRTNRRRPRHSAPL